MIIYGTDDMAFPITLKQTKSGRFTVKYGMKAYTNLTYEKAAFELGECIMDALACEGKIR